MPFSTAKTQYNTITELFFFFFVLFYFVFVRDSFRSFVNKCATATSNIEREWRESVCVFVTYFSAKEKKSAIAHARFSLNVRQFGL